MSHFETANGEKVFRYQGEAEECEGLPPPLEVLKMVLFLHCLSWLSVWSVAFTAGYPSSAGEFPSFQHRLKNNIGLKSV